MRVNFRAISALQRRARGVANRFAIRAVVLLYHRVNELTSDPQLLCVSPKHFSEHLEVIQKHCRPLALRRLSDTLASGSRRRCSAVITFDDGYADNLHEAKPLLEAFNFPATVFIATGHIDSPSGFWKDILERVFLQPGRLPETLRLNIAGTGYQWELHEAAEYSREAFGRYSGWNITSETDPTMRQHLYRHLCRLLRPLSEVERSSVLQKLAAWADMDLTKSSVHRALSADEVVQLANGGTIEVGAHSISHPVLSALPAAEQREEIRGSKSRLEKILGQSVTSFAYPYGGRSYYTSDTALAVREAGFELACSNFEGMVRRGVDMWQLPRLLVRNWNGEEFERRLRGWLCC